MPRAGRLVPLPPHAPGQRIGLYGGSFNPPHAGHAHVVRTAMARLGLDAVWVLVTPGNPLKGTAGLPPVTGRAAAFRSLLSDPRVVITDLEARAGLRYTRDTIRYLSRRASGVRFVWIMGADNLAGFHRWHDWRRIAHAVPIAIVDRPGAQFAASAAPAALALARFRQPEHEARALAGRRPPAWIVLHGRRLAASSTALRRAARAPAL